MSGLWRTVGVAVLSGFAVPVAGISGIAVAGSGLLMSVALFNGSATFFIGAVVFLPALAIFMLTYRWLKAQQQKAGTLVTHINAKEGLSLDCNLRLGSSGPAFLAFDRTHRKIAGTNLQHADKASPQKATVKTGG